MSEASGLIGLVKDVLLFREHLAGVKDDLAGLAQDVAELAGHHAELSVRVARLEGFIEGAAAAAPRRARLPRS